MTTPTKAKNVPSQSPSPGEGAAPIRGPKKNAPRVLFSKAVSSRLLRGVMAGRSIVELCQEPEMPEASTVYRWLQERHEFAEAFDQARQAGVEALIDQLIALSDGVEPLGVDQAPKDADSVQRAKLRIDVRKWVLAKLAPQRFGDRVEAKSTETIDLSERLDRALRRVEKPQKTVDLENK